MDAEDHDITIHGAAASFFFYSFLFWRVSPSGAPRPPAGEARGLSAARQGVGGWGDGEKQLSGETQNVTFKPAEKTGTCSSERVQTSRWSRREATRTN